MVENEPVNPFHFPLLCYELSLLQRPWLIQTNRINAAVTNNIFETVQNTEQSQKEKGSEQPVVCLSLCISNSSKSCINWLELCGWLAERSLLGRWWRPGFHLRKWSYFQFSELNSVGIAFASVVISLLFAFWVHSWDGSKLWNLWLVNTLQMWGCELSIGTNIDPLWHLSMETSQALPHSTSL